MVEKVVDNTQRGFSYKENIKRYYKAMGEGFCFEALLIDYALIEDRLRSYLYYIGVFDRRDDSRGCKVARKQLNAMQGAYLNKPNPGLCVSRITGKMDIVKATLLWFKDQQEPPSDDKYCSALWKQYNERIDADEFLKLLECIDSWREKRNEIVHGLLGKEVNALRASLEPLCAEGFELFRRLDAGVTNVQYHNRIRRAMKMRRE